MNFKEYQAEAWRRAVYPDLGTEKGFIYPTIGLCGEAGEVAEKVKKVLRDKDGIVSPETKELISKELGDVLWYLGAIASELGLDLETIAIKNIEKLTARHAKGMIKGSGDTREEA